MTPELLRAATGCTAERAALFAGPLGEACSHYGITGTARLAAFLAQVGHESGSLRYVAEIWGPTPQQQRYERDPSKPWPSSADEAKQPPFARNRLAFGLGNTQPGDGSRYRGRGLIQTTGRANHVRVRDRLRTRLGGHVPDFEGNPAALEEPRWAAWSAADYWDMRNLNELADAGNFELITRRINGGLNGQADRLARHTRALAALADLPAPQEQPVAPLLSVFLQAALPALIEKIPLLGKVPEKSIEQAVSVVVEAVGARNVQEAVETVLADPQAAQTAQTAVEGAWFSLQPVGGGIEAARAANVAASATDPKRNLALWITLGLLPLIYMTVGSVLWGSGWSNDVKAMTVAAIVSGLLGAITGYWLGTSFSSAKKDERAATPPVT